MLLDIKDEEFIQKSNIWWVLLIKVILKASLLSISDEVLIEMLQNNTILAPKDAAYHPNY